VNKRQIHVDCVREIEILEHLVTSCIVEIKNNTRMIQLLDEKREGVS